MTDATGFGEEQTLLYVPSTNPSVDNSTLYYWLGVTWGTGFSGIMQPVLQYGPSAAGGTAGYWYIDVWAVSPASSPQPWSSWYVSTLIQVYNGDELHLSAALVNPSVSSYWALLISDLTLGGSNYAQEFYDPGTYVINDLWASVFEVGNDHPNGGICACNELPSAVNFEGITIYEYSTNNYINFDPSTYVNSIGNVVQGCGWSDYEAWVGPPPGWVSEMNP